MVRGNLQGVGVWREEKHFQFESDLLMPCVESVAFSARRSSSLELWIGGGGRTSAVRSPPMKQKIPRTSLPIPIIQARGTTRF